jgi:iron complex transport system substrate-binding protein
VRPNFNLLAALLLAIATTGCSRLLQNDNPAAMNQWKARYESSEESLRVLNAMPRDDLNRPVELRAVPQRVAVIGPGAVETVFALGAGDKLVGRDSGTDYPPAALRAPVVGDHKGPNLEQLVAARPDFVIIQGETYGRERLEEWQKQIGVPVAGLAATTVPGVQAGMRKVRTWLE